MRNNFLSFIALAALFILTLNCYQSASAEEGANSQPESPGGTVTLADTAHDYAGTQSVFGPGPGFSGGLLNDYHWVLSLKLPAKNAIKSITINHNKADETWSSVVKDFPPIVAYKDGVKLNGIYDQSLGPLFPGTQTLDLYGQIETYPFAGGKINLVFVDGSSLTLDIPAQDSSSALVPLDNSEMRCTSPASGINYDIASSVTYSTQGTDSHTLPDYCIDLANNVLAEATCGGKGEYAGKQAVYTYHTCIVACSEGACLPAKAN